MEIQQPPQERKLFTKDMQEEFQVVIAKREAMKILRRVEHQKKISALEYHLTIRKDREVVGS